MYWTRLSSMILALTTNMLSWIHPLRLHKIVEFRLCLLYRINFFRSPVNIIDLLATVTFYVDLILSLLEKENDLSEMINLIQVARLFRLTRHSPGLKVSVCWYFCLSCLFCQMLFPAWETTTKYEQCTVHCAALVQSQLTTSIVEFHSVDDHWSWCRIVNK